MRSPHDISSNFFILAYGRIVHTEQLHTVRVTKHHHHTSTQTVTNTDEETEIRKSVYAKLLHIIANPLTQK